MGLNRWKTYRSLTFAGTQVCPVHATFLPASAPGVTASEHPVIAVIARRKKQNSKPGKRKDNFKVCLAVEGGGMRGCVSAGMATALLDAGVLNAFDAIYGSSAGALNSAYLVSGQRLGASIYYQDIANSRFLDLRRIVVPSDRPALDVDYLVDTIIGGHQTPTKALQWESVVSSPIPVKTVTASVTKRTPVVLQNFQTKSEVLNALRATSRVPIVAGDPVRIGNEDLVDGAVFEPVPYRSAMADGCTHVLVLLTRPEQSRVKDPKGVGFPIKARWAKTLIPEYLHDLYDGGYLQTNGDYNRELEYLRRKTKFPQQPLPSPASVQPTPPFSPPAPWAFLPLPSTSTTTTTCPRGCTGSCRCHPTTTTTQNSNRSESSDQFETVATRRLRAVAHSPADVYAVSVPRNTRVVSQLDTNPRRIQASVARGYLAMMKVLEEGGLVTKGSVQYIAPHHSKR